MRLARAHLVEVAAKGVDFAVVREVAEGLRQLPGREGVGAVPLVDEGYRALVVGIRKVGEEAAQLWRVEQPLVDDGAAGERADVECPGVRVCVYLLFYPAAQYVKPAFKFRRIPDFRPFYEKLDDFRAGLEGHRADSSRVYGHVAPEKDFKPLVRRVCLNGEAAALCDIFVARKKNHAHAVLSALGESGYFAAEEFVRNLGHNARPVPRLRVAAHGAPVHQPLEDLDAVFDDFVLADGVEVGHEPDPAGVVFVC